MVVQTELNANEMRSNFLLASASRCKTLRVGCVALRGGDGGAPEDYSVIATIYIIEVSPNTAAIVRARPNFICVTAAGRRIEGRGFVPTTAHSS